MEPDQCAPWHYRETGAGSPLVLLHGLGMSHRAWDAVLPHLPSRRVIAFDIAGFGSTPPLPHGTPPTVANLVDALDRTVRFMGIARPMDIAGNSLGGWMALEAARRGIARTVAAISPAGLWKDDPPASARYTFRALRAATTHVPRLVMSAMQIPLARELGLLPISPGCWRIPASIAARAVEDLATSSAFEETFENTRVPFSGFGISVPVTIAFGDRDWILPRHARRRDRLPPHVNWIEVRGWGHVPMWVDPCGVAQLILHASRSTPLRVLR